MIVNSKVFKWITVFMLSVSFGLFAQENKSLSVSQQKIVLIAAFTANGDTENLKRVIDEGLDSGLTVNEIGEILLQMYAYAGFPRALNGTSVLDTVVKERQEIGKKSPSGNEPELLTAGIDKYALGVKNLGILMGFPLQQKKASSNGYNDAMDVFLKEHLFADIFGRDNISFEMRELGTVGALCSLEGTNSQLVFHMGAVMTSGISQDQMFHLTEIIGNELGKERGENARIILEQVLSRRQ